MKMYKIYISGPMTDRRTGKVSKENIEAFYRAEQRLREAGNKHIVNPARVWACRWPWLYRIVGYRLTLWYDLQLLKRCDAIYLLNGWQDSVGAYEEFKLAFRRNLYVMTEKADINARFDIMEYVGTRIMEQLEEIRKAIGKSVTHIARMYGVQNDVVWKQMLHESVNHCRISRLEVV